MLTDLILKALAVLGIVAVYLICMVILFVALQRIARLIGRDDHAR